MKYESNVTNRWYHSTVQELFYKTCKEHKEKTAIVFEDRQISFADLQNNVHKLSQALINLGVKRDDHVVMLPTSCPEFTYVYFAVLQIGAVINPLNLLWGEIELKSILPRNNPKVIITIDKNGDRDYVEMIKDSIPDLKIEDQSVSSEAIPALTHMVSLSRTGGKHAGFLDFNQLMETGEGYDEENIIRLIEESSCTDIQFMCQTSGSTGLSKSALWNHRSPLSTAHFIIKTLVYSEDDSYLNMSPYYHNSGLAAMNTSLALTGTTLYLMENFHPGSAVEIMQKYKPTATFGFDAHFQALNMVLKSGDFDFTLTKAIAAISPNTYELFVNDICKGRNICISNIYAQTENGPLVTLVEPDCVSHQLRKHTNGRPLPGVELVIKHITTGEKLADGQHGEICYKSPYLFSGYYKQEEETKKLYDEEGYLHSGDYGYMEGGYLRYLGRLGGVVKSGGENVSTTYVSALLMELFPDEFEDVLTVGIPDPYWGTKIVSWVRTKEGKDLRSTNELRPECKNKMAEYEIPKEFLHWKDAWPVTEIGKMDVQVLENLAEKQVGKN
jgi:fatty-acyl-CoA synthase